MYASIFICGTHARFINRRSYTQHLQNDLNSKHCCHAVKTNHKTHKRTQHTKSRRKKKQ